VLARNLCGEVRELCGIERVGFRVISGGGGWRIK